MSWQARHDAALKAAREAHLKRQAAHEAKLAAERAELREYIRAEFESGGDLWGPEARERARQEAAEMRKGVAA